MGKTRISRSERTKNKIIREEKENKELREQNEKLKNEVKRLEKLLADLNIDITKPEKKQKQKPLTLQQQREETRAKFAAWNANRNKKEE